MLFQYTHLSASEIRLVKMLPYSTSESIFLSLEHQGLRQLSDYTVLLHSRDAEQRKPVTLSGRAFMAPAPVVDALKALRGREERFWIEKICVYQSDEDEKRSQANMLPQIVEGATEVLVWVDGDAEELQSLAESELDPDKLASLLASSSVSVEVLKKARSLRLLNGLATEADVVEGATQKSKV